MPCATLPARRFAGIRGRKRLSGGKSMNKSPRETNRFPLPNRRFISHRCSGPARRRLCIIPHPNRCMSSSPRTARPVWKKESIRTRPIDKPARPPHQKVRRLLRRVPNRTPQLPELFQRREEKAPPLPGPLALPPLRASKHPNTSARILPAASP